MYTESSTYDSLLTDEGWFKLPVMRCMVVREHNENAKTDRIRTPADAVAILTSYIGSMDREHLVVLLLTTKNEVIGINTVAIGSLNSCDVDIKQIFKPAIITNAASIILAHNHPSGDPEASPEDIKVTRNIKAAGDLLGIALLDHIVVGDNRSYSIREHVSGIF